MENNLPTSRRGKVWEKGGMIGGGREGDGEGVGARRGRGTLELVEWKLQNKRQA